MTRSSASNPTGRPFSWAGSLLLIKTLGVGLMIRRKSILATLAVLFLATATVLAQEPQPNDSQTGPRAGIMRGLRGERRIKKQRLHLEQELQLSEEQKQQRKANFQRSMLATKAQREQLFQLREKRLTGALTAEDRNRAQQLRMELRQAMAEARKESLKVLTSEQKTRLTTLQQERKQRRDEMRKLRLELRKNRPIG
jgi:Spy/CpxP family protein refolding chaperone